MHTEPDPSIREYVNLFKKTDPKEAKFVVKSGIAIGVYTIIVDYLDDT